MVIVVYIILLKVIDKTYLMYFFIKFNADIDVDVDVYFYFSYKMAIKLTNTYWSSLVGVQRQMYHQILKPLAI